MRRHRKGITLPEVLVVIGILIILFSIMLVVMPRSKAAAHVTACKSNIRQIYVAMELYKADNPGYQKILPEVDVPVLPTTYLVNDRTYIKDPNILYCPITPECARRKLAHTYMFTTTLPSGHPLQNNVNPQIQKRFEDPNYPIIHCLVHDELVYYPSERNLAPEYNPPFVVWANQFGSIKSGRYPMTRGFLISRNCNLNDDRR